jgi:hypothetical protein
MRTAGVLGMVWAGTTARVTLVITRPARMAGAVGVRGMTSMPGMSASTIVVALNTRTLRRVHLAPEVQ